MNLKIESHLSPAKINLFLHDLRRRADGYHELQTLFQLLNYGDELKFETDSNGTLELHQESTDKIRTLPYSQNLIIKAARLLRQESGKPKLGVKIYLNVTKTIKIDICLPGIVVFPGKKPPEAPGVGTPNMNAIGPPPLLTYVLQ